MSAFQAYAGAYEFEGGSFNWRCYATTRVYEVRRSEHAPLPRAPQGFKWMSPSPARDNQDVICLVDESVTEFSQILLQVQGHAPAAPARPARRTAAVATAAA